jgi:EAL domain-containing protein (putative c-di-GMP-specific phosphodiesterase class I)
VTGEGIENLEQFEELRALACDEGQGYYFARPAPPQELSRLLDAGGLRVDVLWRAA